ncbi:MAG: hypothetical protein ACC700_18245 [Anaerolineales bacterium]
MNQNSMFFIGLDLGDKHSHLAILDEDGKLMEETRLPTTRAAFHRKFSILPACRVAMEVGGPTPAGPATCWRSWDTRCFSPALLLRRQFLQEGGAFDPKPTAPRATSAP